MSNAKKEFKETLRLRLSKESIDAVKELAEREGMSLSCMMDILIRQVTRK